MRVLTCDGSKAAALQSKEGRSLMRVMVRRYGCEGDVGALRPRLRTGIVTLKIEAGGSRHPCRATRAEASLLDRGCHDMRRQKD